MFKAYLDNRTLYDPADQERALIAPVLELELGMAGSFTFTLPPGHPLYEDVAVRRSTVSILRDGTEIFFGEVRSIRSDFFRNRTVYCVGALGFLADTVTRVGHAGYITLQRSYILNNIVNEHNTMLNTIGIWDHDKRFAVGQMDGDDSPTKTPTIVGSGESWLEWGRKAIAENGGGYLKARHENNTLYLDWHLPENASSCSQEIRFGENLLDYAQEYNADDICNALIPYGKADKDMPWLHVDITSVNNGLDYLVTSDAGAAAYGPVWHCVIWDDIETPANLLQAANEYLAAHAAPDITLRLTAADLAGLDADIDAFDVGQLVHCVSEPHGLDLRLPVTKLTIPLDDPAGRSLELSDTRKGTYTEMQSGVKRTQDARNTALWRAI